MEILEEFKDVFSDVPNLTNLGEHSVKPEIEFRF